MLIVEVRDASFVNDMSDRKKETAGRLLQELLA
jgi:hypothetical protein